MGEESNTEKVYSYVKTRPGATFREQCVRAQEEILARMEEVRESSGEWIKLSASLRMVVAMLCFERESSVAVPQVEVQTALAA